MKKMFRKIAVLVCVAMLVMAPSSAALASPTSQPVLVAHVPEAYLKSFQYKPDPLDLYSGQQTHLADTTAVNGQWVIPSGKAFTFSCNVPSGSVQVDVVMFMVGGSAVVHSQFYPSGFSFTIPAQQQSRSYLIVVTAVGQTQISDYIGFAQ
jgi:hypothetical protein